MSLDTVVNDIADELVKEIEGLSVKDEVKAYKWSAGPSGGMDKVPAAIVQLPEIERTGVDQKEDHLGALDLRMEIEVFFFFDASRVDYTMPQALETVSAFIDALDTNLDLSGKAQEVKVTKSEPVNVDTSGGNSRALFGYSCTVGVLAFF